MALVRKAGGIRNFGYCAEGVQVRYKLGEEGWHPSKRVELLVGGKCTADFAPSRSP
jgi:hypothetical protein